MDKHAAFIKLLIETCRWSPGVDTLTSVYWRSEGETEEMFCFTEISGTIGQNVHFLYGTEKVKCYCLWMFLKDNIIIACLLLSECCQFKCLRCEELVWSDWTPSRDLHSSSDMNRTHSFPHNLEHCLNSIILYTQTLNRGIKTAGNWSQFRPSCPHKYTDLCITSHEVCVWYIKQ